MFLHITNGEEGVKKEEVDEDEGGSLLLLTKGCNDGTRDAVGHADCKDTHGPGVLQAKLELIGLALQIEKHKHLKAEHNLMHLT